MAHDFAVQVFPDLPGDVKAMLEGFARGVNYFIETHRGELPAWVEPEFTAQDVAAKDFSVWDESAARGFMVRRLGRRRGPAGDFRSRRRFERVGLRTRKNPVRPLDSGPESPPFLHVRVL